MITVLVPQDQICDLNAYMEKKIFLNKNKK